MKVSIIIPVYNEQHTVQAILEKVLALPLDKEVVVVNDCSDDNTEEILRGIKHPDLRIIHGIENRGKGHAVRLGLKHARGDIILIQDADFEYDPLDIPKLVAPIAAGETEIVYGSRFMEANELIPAKQRIANRYFNILTNVIHKTQFTDVCNCYKVFRADIIKGIELTSDGFEVCHEITGKLAGGYRLRDIPIHFHPNTRAEGKKVSWTDIFASTWAILKFSGPGRLRKLFRCRGKS